MNNSRRDAMKYFGVGTCAAALSGCGGSDYSEQTTQTETVIIGAGFAGLEAARQLKNSGRSFVLLEARDRVGGRSWTVSENDYWIDNGAQWVEDSQEEIIKIMEPDNLNIEKYTGFPLQDKVVVLFDGNRYEVPVDADKPANVLGQIVLMFGVVYPDAVAEYDRLRQLLDAMALTINDPSRPYEATDASTWDAMSFQTWIDMNLNGDTITKKGAEFLFNVFVNMAFSVPKAEMSLTHVLVYVSGARGDGKRGFEALNNAVQYRVIGGTQAIAQKMFEQVQNAVKLNEAVRSIDYSDTDTVIVKTQNSSYKASNVILAIPSAMVNRIVFTPPLPAKRAQLQNRLPLGSAIKCHLVYEEAFWIEAGFNGVFISDEGLVAFGTDNSTPPNNTPILACFVDISKVRSVMNDDDTTLEEKVTLAMENIFKPSIPAMPKPVKVYIANWNAQEFSRGGYATVFPPSAWTQFQMPLNENVNNRLFWTGTETSDRWYAYMDGAIRAGRRVIEKLTLNS